MMFSDLHNVSLFKAREAFSSIMELNSVEAERLSRYIIEPRDIAKIDKKKYDLRIDEVINNIEQLAKPIIPISNDTIVNFLKELASNQNLDQAKRLLNLLEGMEVVQSITIDKMRNDLELLFTSSSKSSQSMQSSSQKDAEYFQRSETELILAYLMRESKSAYTITCDAMKSLQSAINKFMNGSESSFEEDNKLLNPCHKRIYHIKETEVGDTEPEPIEDFESEHVFSENSEDISGVHLNIGDNSEIGDRALSNSIEDFIISLSKFLKQKRKTLFDLIHNCVYDMIFNSLEVQLIDSYYLFLCLENNGFKVKNESKISIVKGLKHKYSLNGIDVVNLQLALEEIGAPEICSDKSYKELKGYEIRIFNRIIQQIDERSINVKEFFGVKNFKSITISSPNRPSTDFEIISLDKFTEILEENKLYSDEEIIDEIEDSNFINLISLSKSNKDKILLKKLEKLINALKSNRYFNYFSCSFRDIDIVHEKLNQTESVSDNNS